METIEKTADVVVAGSGGTGLAAAYAAAQAGLKVLVIEKLSQIGGNTRISSGFFAIDTNYHRAAGLSLSKAAAIQQLITYNHYLANGPLIKKIIMEGEATLAWLETMGMEIALNKTADTTQFAHRGDDYRGGSYHMYQNKDDSYQRIQKTLEQAGVTFLFDTILQTILMTDQQEVAGVTATNQQGDTLVISASAVVIATGGYGANKEKVAKVMNTDRMRSLGVPNMGEGLFAMEKVGAVDIDSTALIHAAQLKKSTVTQKTSDKTLAGFSSSLLSQLLLSPLLWVNQSGQRFANEDVIYDTAEWANAGWSAGGSYFFITDTATLKDYGRGTPLLISKAGPGATSELGNFVQAAEDAVAGETAFKGETLEELASHAGMCPTVLAETVNRYNQCVRDQQDTDYGKSAESLTYTVEQGPYYAFTAQVAYLGTIGGVRVNEHMQVLNKELQPIHGLFTGGASAGGYYQGHSYPTYEGMASGFAWTSGKIAGTSAADYIKNR